MRIGIVGAGNIGGTLARLWVEGGHEVFVSSRHPDRLQGLVEEIGRHAASGTVEEAARFGEVILLAIPLGGFPSVTKEIAAHVKGKAILDAMNPFPQRDGEPALEIQRRGIASGQATQERLREARVVRAFSTVNYRDLRSQARRRGERVAIPYAGDDLLAKEVGARLIRDAGFEPYDLGRLADARPQDPGGILFGKAYTAKEIREELQTLKRA